MLMLKLKLNCAIITASRWAKYTIKYLIGDCPYLVALESDNDLYTDYYYDFKGWIKELFYKVDRNTLKSLKMVLRYRGDPVEFKAMIFDQRLRAYKRQQNAKQTPLIANKTIAYREITPFPQQPRNGVPGRPLELLHDPYKTLPPRWRAEMFYIQVVDRGDSFSNAYITTTTFARTRMENPNKSLYKNFKGKNALQLKIALFKLATICEGLFTDLYNDSRREFITLRWKKKCFERKAARTQFFSACYFIGTLLPADFSVHLAEYKGTFIHYISSEDIYSRDDRYTRSVYQGILPDTGAANVSIEDPTVTMDTSTAGKTSIKFGKGKIGKIDFKVLDAPTPLKVYFNNTTDKLFYLNKRERATAFLIKIELLKDAGHNNFKERTFKQITKSKPILYETWQALRMFAEFRVEAHWSVGKIERYHAPLHRAWDILYAELAGTMSNKAILQIAIKAINNIVGPNSLVLTLLVFGVYPRITIELPPLPEKDRWNSPYKIAAIDGHNVTVDMVNGPTTFRSISNLNTPGYLPRLRNKRKANVYITKKEEANLKLAIKLRNDRISNLRVIIALAPMLDIKALNKRLKWQIENLNRGLRYIPVNLINAKLIVFVDSSFANNKDLSLQLGFILMLINKSIDVNNAFIIYSNIIHYSLIKCKRVTRSVLASKIYSMIIIKCLSLPAVPLVVYTDSYSLYECLVKLGTTKEKRLIINIIALR
ncbi:hypothetical protein BU23DRAFT_582695 [Bimuria novae-zelandiae CBS 107.79]|uniref:Uncharacterized protein n=1 Tax=Bimuria novae-zelandiae CBS 107.79 TaxID=1447943 RepID=A0A6A5UW24_9PLEO|nr:hypothetical protein BU23DRAFT_582695 [Bimuria novae-zelandiae CBS 107.79]